MCFVHFVGLCLWIHCVSYVTALSDIVALLGTLSRLGLPYGTFLSTWKWPWKRAPEVTSGRFFAGRDASRRGRDANRRGQDVSRGGQDAGGSLSHPDCLLEVSFR